MNQEQAAALRAPFRPEQIGQLPRGGIMLDYVGHAATTDRLLQVDPEWTWEPVCVGPNGEPLIVDGGLWIRLTVAGVTRYGYGDGPNVKEMIGDAIRNAAMRFGVALDLWAKEPLAPHEKTVAAKDPEEEWKKRNKKMRYLLGKLDEEQPREDGADWTAFAKELSQRRWGKVSTKDLTPEEHQALIDELEAFTVPFG